MDLENKVALITGGARGIGAVATKELLRNGVKHVTIVDLVTSNGEESAKKFNSEFGKGRAIFVACDVTKSSEFEAAFAKTVEEFGGLDIVINNAGVASENRWEMTIDVNINGVIRGTHLGLDHMGKHKGGKGGVIVNMASIFGLDTFPWSPVYTATKHAVVGFSKCFGNPYYYEKTGVRVVTLCPGITETPLTANGVVKIINLVETEVAMADMVTYQYQKAENVARATVHLIKSVKNGSVWVSEGEEPAFEVSSSDRFARRI